MCQSLKDGLVNLGVPSKHIQVIMHGVDLALFQPPADRQALRKRLNLNGRTLLSVGNLIELKGHHIAIEALSRLPGMELIIAGRGQLESELKQCARFHHVEGRVRFLGYVGQQGLREYYGAADALVIASSREGIPNVLLESMACGTPAVATNVGGIADIVTSRHAGILCTARSPTAIAEGVDSPFFRVSRSSCNAPIRRTVHMGEDDRAAPQANPRYCVACLIGPDCSRNRGKSTSSS